MADLFCCVSISELYTLTTCLFAQYSFFSWWCIIWLESTILSYLFHQTFLCSIEELQRLLKDKEAYNAFFNSLDQVKTQNNVSSVARTTFYICDADFTRGCWNPFCTITNIFCAHSVVPIIIGVHKSVFSFVLAIHAALPMENPLKLSWLVELQTVSHYSFFMLIISLQSTLHWRTEWSKAYIL